MTKLIITKILERHAKDNLNANATNDDNILIQDKDLFAGVC